MLKAWKVSILLLAMLACASQLRAQENSKSEAPKASAAAETHAAENHSSDSGPVVDLAGGLSSSYVQRQGGTLDFWLRVANHGTKPLTGMKLVLLDRSGVYYLTGCWNGSPESPTGTLSTTSCAMKDVAANEEETVGGTLETHDQADSENLGAVVEWGPTSSAWVSLGNVSSDIGLTYWLETHTVLLSFFGAAFLGLLAFGAKEFYDRRRAEDESKKTQKAETWNQLLTEATGISRKYYLPMWGALQAFVQEAEKHLVPDNSNPCSLAAPAGAKPTGAPAAPVAQPAAPPVQAPAAAKPGPNTGAVTTASVASGAGAAPTNDGKVAFYYWCAFERRCLEIQRKISGFHFKNYTGELIVQGAYYKYREFFYDRKVSDRTIVDDLLEDTPLNRLILSDFLEELNSASCDPSYDSAWKTFHPWLHSDEAKKALEWLKAVDPVLGYETNRPYYYWYGWLEPVELSAEQKELLKTLGDTAQEKMEIAIYLRDATDGRQRESAPGWLERWWIKITSRSGPKGDAAKTLP